MWFSSSRDARVRDEITVHRDRLIDDDMAAGMGRADAERRAFLEFGNAPQIEEAVRDVRGHWLEDLRRDLLYALRTLGRDRGFTAVAVLSLALGIGANAAIFSLINAVMLRALPVREPDRLVQISRWSAEGRPHPFSYSHPRSPVESTVVTGGADVQFISGLRKEFLVAPLQEVDDRSSV